MDTYFRFGQNLVQLWCMASCSLNWKHTSCGQYLKAETCNYELKSYVENWSILYIEQWMTSSIESNLLAYLAEVWINKCFFDFSRLWTIIIELCLNVRQNPCSRWVCVCLKVNTSLKTWKPCTVFLCAKLISSHCTKRLKGTFYTYKFEWILDIIYNGKAYIPWTLL